MLRPESGKRIYDPCCGSGGMFSQSLKFIKAHSGNRGDVSVFGQEANPDTWKMAKINMAIRGRGDQGGDRFHAGQVDLGRGRVLRRAGEAGCRPQVLHR